MNGFEGYVGVRVGEGQLVDDLIFSLLFILFFVFSFVFHTHYHVFRKMVRDVFHVRERLSLFEEIDGNETLFRNFMIFQSLLLCSIGLYMVGRFYQYIPDYRDLRMNLFSIGVIFVILFTFYGFKRFLYRVAGMIFATFNLYEMWKAGYTATIGLWGVLLYIPILCLAFVKGYLPVYVFLFAFLYILWRFIIIHKTIYIFNVKGIGFLYIILYLCAQEILPLIFLYEGVICLYNLY
jgi:hypothetical protein